MQRVHGSGYDSVCPNEHSMEEELFYIGGALPYKESEWIRKTEFLMSALMILTEHRPLFTSLLMSS